MSDELENRIAWEDEPFPKGLTAQEWMDWCPFALGEIKRLTTELTKALERKDVWHERFLELSTELGSLRTRPQEPRQIEARAEIVRQRAECPLCRQGDDRRSGLCTAHKNMMRGVELCESESWMGASGVSAPSGPLSDPKNQAQQALDSLQASYPDDFHGEAQDFKEEVYAILESLRGPLSDPDDEEIDIGEVIDYNRTLLAEIAELKSSRPLAPSVCNHVLDIDDNVSLPFSPDECPRCRGTWIEFPYGFQKDAEIERLRKLLAAAPSVGELEHILKVELGEFTRYHLTCNLDDSAPCHQVCATHMEGGCADKHLDPDIDQAPCVQEVYRNGCVIAEWVNDGGIESVGFDHTVELPVTYYWDGAHDFPILSVLQRILSGAAE